MKHIRFKSVVAMILVISLFISSSALGEYHAGDVVYPTVSDEDQAKFPDVYTDAKAEIERREKENSGSVSSDADIGRIDKDTKFTGTTVPITYVTQGDMELVYDKDGVAQWAQSLQLSADTISKLFEHYKLGAYSPETVQEVVSGWEQVIKDYKDQQDSYGDQLDKMTLEKFVNSFKSKLKDAMPDKLDTSFMHDEDYNVEGTDRTFGVTDGTSGNGQSLGEIEAKMRGVILDWARKRYKQLEIIAGSSVPANYQVYESDALYDPSKQSNFKNTSSLLNNPNNDSTSLMLEQVYEIASQVKDTCEVDDSGNKVYGTLAVPQYDAQGNLKVDDDGKPVMKYVPANNDLTIQDASAMALDQYVATMQTTNPDMPYEEVLKTPTGKTLLELASPGTADERRITLYNEKFGNLDGVGFSDPRTKEALEKTSAEKLNESLQASYDLLDPSKGSVVQETNVSTLILTDDYQGGNAFTNNQNDASLQTRALCTRIRDCYINAGNNITTGNMNLSGLTRDQVVRQISDDLSTQGNQFENTASYDNPGFTDYETYQAWHNNPLGDPDWEDSGAYALNKSLDEHPELFDEQGKFVDTPENRKTLSDSYFSATSSITSINVEFNDDDYVYGENATGAQAGVVSYDAAVDMGRNLEFNVFPTFENYGIKLGYTTTSTNYTGLSIDLSTPEKAEIWREVLEEQGLGSGKEFNTSGSGVTGTISISKLQESLTEKCESRGVDSAWALSVNQQLEHQKDLSGSDYAVVNSSYGGNTGAKTTNSVEPKMVDFDSSLYLFMGETPSETYYEKVFVPATELEKQKAEHMYGYLPEECAGEYIMVPKTTGKSQAEISADFSKQYIEPEDSGFILASVFENDPNNEMIYGHPNTDIYANEDGSFLTFSASGFDGIIARNFSFGNMKFLNKKTGQIIQLDGVYQGIFGGDLEYKRWCAATHDYMMVQDSQGNWGYISKENYQKALRKCAEDHGIDPSLVGAMYMYVDSDHKQHIGIDIDTASLILNPDNPLPIDELKKRMGEITKNIGDMADAEGVGNINIGDEAGDVIEELAKIFKPGSTAEWREWAIEYFKQQGITLTDEELDQILNIVEQLLQDEDFQLIFDKDKHNDEEGEDEGENKGKEDSDSWSWDDLIKEFEKQFGKKPDDMTYIEYIETYLPEFLSTYSGQKLFNAKRIVTKQVSEVKLVKLDSKYRKGNFKWTKTKNGKPAGGGSGPSTSMVLSVGTNVAACSAQMQNVYMEQSCYNYYEYWVLEGVPGYPGGMVIYQNEIKGQLPGDNSEGKNMFSSSVRYGVAAEEGVCSFTYEVPEEEPNSIIGEGNVAVTNKSTTYGFWLNGMKIIQNNGRGNVTVPTVTETTTYRID